MATVKELVQQGTEKVGASLTRAADTTKAAVRQRRARLRKVVTGSADVKVRDHLRAKRDKLMRALRRPVAAKAKDKFSFTMGVSVMLASEFVVLKYPTYFALWYTAIMIPLLFIRYFLYHRLKYQYFMLDFCYFVQVLCFAHIFIWPQSRLLSQSIFLFSNGPLIWAIAAWRNSLVFHSLDKTTSLFIHVFPTILTLVTRWYPNTGMANGCTGTSECGVAFSELARSSLGIYLAWQLAYVLKTDVVDHKKLQRDQDIQTSTRWFIRAKRGMLYHLTLKLMKRVGVMKADEGFKVDTWKTKMVFMGAQLVYTLVTGSLAIVFFHSYYAHLTFLLFMILLSVWNGAVYYIEVFSTRYREHIEELMREGGRDGPGFSGDADFADAPPPTRSTSFSSTASHGSRGTTTDDDFLDHTDDNLSAEESPLLAAATPDGDDVPPVAL